MKPRRQANFAEPEEVTIFQKDGNGVEIDSNSFIHFIFYFIFFTFSSAYFL